MARDNNGSAFSVNICANTSVILSNLTDVLCVIAEHDDDSQEVDKKISASIWTGRVGIYGLCGTLIAIFGLVGNIISIIVLSRYRQKSSAPLLLIVLALFDSVVLGSELFVGTFATLGSVRIIPYDYILFLRPIYLYFFTLPFIGQTGTTCMTVLITIERYIAVVKPFLAPRLCKKSFALKACAAIFVWSIVYHIPRYLAYDNFDTWRNETNSTHPVFGRTSFGESHFYNEVYFIWINFSLEFVLPCTVLVVLNIQMLRALRRSRKMELNTTNRKNMKNEKQHLTAMVLAVTAMFFFCELFSVISLILVRGLNWYSQCSVACNNFISLADTMVIVNSASNFILYCVVGNRFRMIFKQLFCRCLPKKRYNVGSSSSTNITFLSHSKSR